MAYASPYGQAPPPPRHQQQQLRTPRGGPPTFRGPYQQQSRDPYNYNNNGTNDYDNRSYQQDWQQNDFGANQDMDNSYEDYAVGNPYYDEQQQDPGYGAHPSTGADTSYDRRDRRHDRHRPGHEQGSNRHGHPSGHRNDPHNRQPRDRHHRPPHQQYPPRGPPPSNRMDPRGRGRGPPNQRPPPSAYPKGQGPRSPINPGPARPPPDMSSQHQDPRSLQSPVSPVENSQDRSYGSNQQVPAASQPYGRPSMENYNSYDGYDARNNSLPSQDQPRSFVSPYSTEAERKPPPPNFSRVKEHPLSPRPGTATGVTTEPPRIDLPLLSSTQPSTPLAQSFDQAYPSSQPHWQDPRTAPAMARNFDSAFDRPGSSADSRQNPSASSAYGANHVRTASPEEMPAFGNSSNQLDNDPLHTKPASERAGQDSRYTPYSPQVGHANLQGYGNQSTDRGLPGQPSGGPIPPGLQQGPPPPVHRSATADDQYWANERAPVPRPGLQHQNQSYGDPRGARMNGQGAPGLNHQPNSFPTELPHGRPRPSGGPPRPDMGRPDPNAGPGDPRAPGPRPNPPGFSSRPGTSSSNYVDASRGGTPNQGPAAQQPKTDPDALPYHPSPVRPGAMQNGQRGGPMDKPVPVRQYDGGSRPASSHQTKAARRQSVPVTPDELTRLRDAVSRNPTDKEAQFMLVRKLSEAAFVLVDDGGRADARMREQNRRRYNGEAMQLLQKLVTDEYPDAMFFLADCYGDGKLEVHPDSKEAFGLYQSAAKLGHAGAAYRTAVCCEIGPEDGGGTRKDPEKAVQWYKRAANLGDIPAAYKMGIILLKGLLGQQRNLAESVNFLKLAAERADHENPHALHELGLIYENPSNYNLRNDAQALQYFMKAGKLGYKLSQFKLGQAYEYGLLGCPVDPKQSIVWYSKGAAQGEHECELAVSGWYLTGAEGLMEPDDTEAFLWARKAAIADPPVPKALFAMGYFNEVGIGCPRSLEEAKKWYGRAASSQFPKAHQRLDELRRHGSKVQKHRERLSRSNQRQQEENCAVM